HLDRLHLPTWIPLGFDDESDDPASACISVRLREQDADVGLVGDRREHLLADDAIDVAVTPRKGLHRSEPPPDSVNAIMPMVSPARRFGTYSLTSSGVPPHQSQLGQAQPGACVH